MRDNFPKVEPSCITEMGGQNVVISPCSCFCVFEVYRGGLFWNHFMILRFFRLLFKQKNFAFQRGEYVRTDQPNFVCEKQYFPSPLFLLRILKSQLEIENFFPLFSSISYRILLKSGLFSPLRFHCVKVEKSNFLCVSVFFLHLTSIWRNKPFLLH